MKTVFVTIAACLLASFITPASAKITLPSLLSDHMVLQQNTEVKLWGKSDRKTVSAITSWDNKEYSADVDADGCWLIKVRTPQAGGPFEIMLTDGTAITLEDVLIGEVWLCSGQSNMEMPIKGAGGQPVAGSFETLLNVKPQTPIRMAKIAHRASKKPEEETEGGWKISSPQHVANATAVGYYFAECLHNMLNIPIGIIDDSWSGSTIEAWMDREMLKPFVGLTTIDFPETDINEIKRPHRTPQLLYNGMIAPVVNYAIKGVLWYQGESNMGAHAVYERLLPAMVSGWRTKWQQGNFPFYYVQIPPYQYDGDDALRSALFREAQTRCLPRIPNSGMAVTIDLGERQTVHPPQKKPIGERLAALVLAKTYKIEGIPCAFPTYRAHERKGNKITVTFDNAPLGLKFYGDIHGFEVAGEDRKFYPAQVEIKHIHATVWSDEVPNPVAVRYGFKNVPNPTPNLIGVNNLPAAPFRTDNW